MDFEIKQQTVPLVSPDYTTERNKSMPSLNHGTIQANLIMELAAYRSKFKIVSETSLALEQWPSVPDISILPKMEMDLWNDEVSVKNPPLCVIEILSPTQSLTELTNNASEYLKYGVQSCWIVLPTLANIYVFKSPNDYTIFRATETLVDEKMDIAFPLVEVFK